MPAVPPQPEPPVGGGAFVTPTPPVGPGGGYSPLLPVELSQKGGENPPAGGGGLLPPAGPDSVEILKNTMLEAQKMMQTRMEEMQEQTRKFLEEIARQQGESAGNLTKKLLFWKKKWFARKKKL